MYGVVQFHKESVPLLYKEFLNARDLFLQETHLELRGMFKMRDDDLSIISFKDKTLIDTFEAHYAKIIDRT